MIVDNKNVEVRTAKFGRSLFAIRRINKDEIIAVFDGKIYQADKATDLPKDIADHAVQVGQHEWKDSNGFARYINHSCEPNVGYRGVDTLVAMRDILSGEELVLDYDMSENSDWKMQCQCGAPSCRRIIGSHNNLSQELRDRYNGYFSPWLTQ